MSKPSRIRTFRPTVETLEERAAPTDLTPGHNVLGLASTKRLDDFPSVPHRLVNLLGSRGKPPADEPDARREGVPSRQGQTQRDNAADEKQQRPAETKAEGFESPEDLFAAARFDEFVGAQRPPKRSAAPESDDGRKPDGGGAQGQGGSQGANPEPAPKDAARSGPDEGEQSARAAQQLGGNGEAVGSADGGRTERGGKTERSGAGASGGSPVALTGGGRALSPQAGAASSSQGGGILVVGADAGAQPRVKVYDAATRSLKFSFLAEAASFRGGVRVAAGDVTGDGVSDVVTAAGAGGNNRVRVWDGTDGSLLHVFTAFTASQSDGVFVATGDVNGDGDAEILAGTDQGGAGLLRVFGAGGGASTLSLGADFQGGVRVAAGDVDADGKDDLIAAAGPGALARVRVFDGGNGAEVYNFFAGDPTYRGGLFVASGDLDGDGRDDVVTGAAQGTPEVRVFGSDTRQRARFLAEPDAFEGGVRVATADVNDDGHLDLVTGTGPGAGAARAFDGARLEALAGFTPFGAAFTNGLFVAADGPAGTPEGGGFSTLSSDPVVTVVASTPATLEGDTETVVFTVTRTGDTTDPLDVCITMPIGTAGPDDYTITHSAAMTIPAGESSADYPVTVVDDDLIEGPETLLVHVVDWPGYEIGSPGSAVVVILDDDGPAPLAPMDCVGVVRPVDGVFSWSWADLSSSGFGGWGQALSWGSDPGQPGSGGIGNGVVSAQLPFLRTDSAGTVAVSLSAGSALYFDPVWGGYQARHFSQEQLTYDSGSDRYSLEDTAGGRTVFYGFDTGLPAAKRGTLDKYVGPGGNETTVTAWATDGKPQEVQSSSTIGSDSVTESYLYGYTSGRMSSVTLRRQTNGGSWATVRSVEYSYYGASESHGNDGDLKLAVVKDGAGTVIDRRYVRYYKPGETGGYPGGLKYQFGHESYGRLAAAFSTPETATDAQVEDYADVYLEYDAARRVSELVAQGAGCSVCTGGLGTYTFVSAISGFADGYNSWRTKQVTTLPDGNTLTSYVNFAGQSILEIFEDTTSTQEWLSFSKYDGNGRLILSAAPSAVSGYDESKPDLLDNQSGDYQYLRDSLGLVETFTYGSSTTATDTTAGDVAGYLAQTAIQRGETGTSVPQSQTLYLSRTANSQTIFVPAEQTQYRNTNGTGSQTTTAAYSWLSGTLQAEQVTATLPTVTTAQNGPNAATSSTVALDSYGRVIWTKDAEGFLSYTQYDQASGGVVKTISDVDTTQTSTFSDLPSGWSTPTGGGLHLTTTAEVDHLGRVTKMTDPAGKISYTVYNDTNHEVRVYRGWDTSSNAPTGPTEVMREDRAGGYGETLTMSATPSVDGGRPTGQESIGSLQSLSRSTTNAAGQVIHSDEYVSFASLSYSTSTTLGTENTHFYRTRQGYDQRGRPNMTKTPTGTIYRTVYDGLGRVVSQWVGTDDTGATNSDPTGGGATGNNMVKVSENQYDGGGVGDSNLTQMTAIPGGSAVNRVSQFHYDWRNRLVASKGGVQVSESTDVQRPISYVEYDNLGSVVVSEQYDGDNVTISDANSDGVPDRPSSSLLRAKSTASFDELGRAYRTETFSVDPSSGSVSTNSLKTDLWFDSRGHVIKTARPDGIVKKSVIDGVGRVTKFYTTDGGSDSAWSDADDVSGDVVLEQTENSYDAASNVILVTSRQRFHNETGTGELGTISTGVKARINYSAAYYDKADRLTDSVNVGSNGGSAWTRPSSVPSRSDTVLVTSRAHDAAGRVESITDPRGLVTRHSYDARGLVTKTIEAYTDGTVTDTTNKTTESTYNGAGALTTLKVLLTGSGYQKTEWVYGVSSTTGSDITSNDILYAVKYPDKTTGDPSTSEQETSKVNARGEVKESTDRNGNVHAFSRDVLGRLTADAVTTLGSGVDGAVRRIETVFDSAGRPYLFSNYDAATGGTVVNQVRREFNGLGQLVTEYQAVSGSVDTGTTPKVQYAYSEMASGANHSRLTSMTYPDGKVLTYNYSSGLNSSISRLSSLSDTTGSLEEYDYLGLDTVVRRGHSQPGVDLTFIKLSTESVGDAGDQYTGLDRFGRVVDQRWLDTGTNAATDRFEYGYDRNSNRLYRENLVDAAFSELYHANGASNGYDPTNQLTDFRRGTLSDSNSDNVPDTVTTATRSQSWDHDNLGNFDSQSSDGSPTSRSHNRQNQVTAVGAASLAHDNNGNLTTDEQGRTLVYDAWNRLVTVKQGTTTLVSHTHDALGRRVTQNSGTARALYYSASWQVVEERESGVVRVQTVFSPVYVDAIVLRDRDSDGNGSLDERLWVQQDANFNVSALLDNSGSVVERFVYDPFGQVSFLTPSFGARAASLYGWVVLHQGSRYDAASGLYDSRHRWRSPSLGRWLQNDPLGLRAGDVNFVRLLANNPATMTDPNGLSTQSKFEEWYDAAKEEGLTWTLDFPACPCTVRGEVFSRCRDRAGYRTVIGVNPDEKVWDLWWWNLFAQRRIGGVTEYHPGAYWELRSWPNDSGARQQCCYDKWGYLITHGAGAGTADRSAKDHWAQDVDPYEWALKLDGGTPGKWVDKYLEVRPIDKKNKCPKNP